MRVFPNAGAAQSWLSRGEVGLDGSVPSDFAKSEFGARAIEDLIKRIQFSVLA